MVSLMFDKFQLLKAKIKTVLKNINLICSFCVVQGKTTQFDGEMRLYESVDIFLHASVIAS